MPIENTPEPATDGLKAMYGQDWWFSHHIEYEMAKDESGQMLYRIVYTNCPLLIVPEEAKTFSPFKYALNEKLVWIAIYDSNKYFS
jgi:hypothetical protein